MVKLNKYKLRLIARNRGIKNYLNMSREKLLSTLDKSERITENLSKNRLNEVVKQKDSLTKEEKQEKKSYTDKLESTEEFFQKLEEDLNRL